MWQGSITYLSCLCVEEDLEWRLFASVRKVCSVGRRVGLLVAEDSLQPEVRIGFGWIDCPGFAVGWVAAGGEDHERLSESLVSRLLALQTLLPVNQTFRLPRHMDLF